MQVDTGQFRALTDRVTELEAQITQWHTWIEPTRDIFQLWWDLAYDEGRRNATARRPPRHPRRPGHLRAVEPAPNESGMH